MSLLSRQLETHRINNPLPPPVDAKKSRPTILFTSFQASNLDAKQILDLGRNGFQSLCQIQSDLQDYQLLFGTVLGSDAQSEHHLLPRSEKERVDQLCAQLVRKLSPHYSLEPAVHVLEFLIQRYYVHVVSPDELLSSLLPHHETKLFSTVVRLVMAQHAAAAAGTATTKWAFLKRFSEAPNGVPRAALVMAAVKDMQLLDAIGTVSSQTSPKFFAAFALECLSTGTNLDSTVLVVCRCVVDLLKSENPATRSLAALVISGLARSVTLSTDAGEALLRLLAKRIVKLQDAEEDEQAEKDTTSTTDLVKCLVMLYEWQNNQLSAELFADTKAAKWDKFSQLVERIFSRLVTLEAQQQHCCSLVDKLLEYAVHTGQPERFFPQLKWDEQVFASRATRVVGWILSQDSDQPQWSQVLQQISLEQPGAFQACTTASARPANGLKMQFNDANTVFLSLRSPNRMIRQAALAYLEQPSAEFRSELTASLVAHWGELYLDETSDSSSAGEDLARLLAVYASSSSGGDEHAEMLRVLKLVVTKSTTTANDNNNGEALALKAVDVLRNEPVFLASVLLSATATAAVKQLCAKRVKKTWMDGVGDRADYAQCSKHLVDELKTVQEKRGAVNELYSVCAPAVALHAVEHALLLNKGSSDAEELALIALELMERGHATCRLANSAASAPVLVKLLQTKLGGFPVLATRVLEHGDAAWANAYPVFIEAVRLAGANKADELLWGAALSPVAADEKEAAAAERRVVRTLRVLACQPTTAGAKKGSSSARWVSLVPLVRHQTSSQVRTLASQLLLGKLPQNALGTALRGREKELALDGRTLDRAVAGDADVRATLLAELNSASSSSPSAATTTACLVELLKDSDVARKVLLKWLPLGTSAGAAASVCQACFACYSGKEAAATEKDVAVLELGIKHLPLLTLQWATTKLTTWAESKAKFSVFESLYELAQNPEQDAAVVALSIKLLATGSGLVFDGLDFAKRLQAVKTVAAAVQARAVQILVECISASGFSNTKVLSELLRLLPLSREFGVLEQSLLVAVERNIGSISQGDGKGVAFAWPKLVDEMCSATTLPGRLSARRAFTRSSPDSAAVALAFTRVGEFALFVELEHALTSTAAGDDEAEAKAQVVSAVVQRTFELLPFADHHVLLARVASKYSPGNASRLIAQWLALPHASRNAKLMDAAFVASQFDSARQTDILIQLMPHKHCVEFIAHHLGSKVFMKALVASVDETKSVQFIQLFELLLEQLVRQGDESDNDEDDEEEEERTAHLETALDRLSVLLSIHVFVPVMAETLAESHPVKIRNLALRVLKLKIADEYRDWTKEEVKYVMDFVYTLISWLQQPGNKHATTILALNSFASVLASSHAAAFAKAIPVLSRLLVKGSSSSAGAGAVSKKQQKKAKLAAAAGEAYTPVPQQELSAEEKQDDEMQRSAVILCLGTICRQIGVHSLTYLNELVPKMIACCKVQHEGQVLRQAALHALRDIVEAKLAINLGDLVELIMLDTGAGSAAGAGDESMDALIESLGKAMTARTGVAVCLGVLRKRGQGAPCASGLVALLDQIVSRLVPAELPALAELTDLCVECCQCEDAGEQIVSVVVKIALLLSEKKLKTVLDALVELARKQQTNGGVVDVVLDVLRGLVNKCGSLVLPIMPMQFMVEMLEGSNSQQQQPPSNKKARLSQQASAASSSPEAALGAVGECLVHAIGTRFVDMALFESLLAALVLAVQASDAETSQSFVEPALASLALCSLSQPSGNAMLQTLHHALTRLFRSSSASSSAAGVRLNALSCIKTLFERVGDDYLALMPDTLPFLAELLEDKDAAVRALAQKLALVLKDLSGEDIAEFLK